jgi:hypothetical protein
MENEVKNPAGASAADAGKEPVKKVEDALVAEVLDASALKIKELEADKIKLAEERENYRVGMLSAKTKLKTLKDQGYDVGDESPQLSEDSIVDKVVERLKPILEPKQQVESLNVKISELAAALRNRSQVGGSAAGSNQESVEVKTEYFTPEQLADIKARGLDPEKVKQNIIKYKQKTV